MKNRVIIGISIRRNYMITYLARVENLSTMYYGKSVTKYIHNKWNNEGRYWHEPVTKLEGILITEPIS